MVEKHVDIIMPEQEGSESIVEKWLKQEGSIVDLHEPLVEISTDKVTVEISVPASGILSEIIKKEGDHVAHAEILGRITAQEDSSVSESTTNQNSKPKTTHQIQVTEANQEIRLSPAVRRLIIAHDINVNHLNGTGRGGRITYQDVEQYIETSQSKTIRVTKRVEKATETSISSKIPHSLVRLQIANHMVNSMLKTAPHVTAVFEVDLTSIMAHRRYHKEKLQRQSIRLTYTAYFVMAAINALKSVPEVNSRWYEDELEIFNDCNVGIATAIPNGLVVPVIHSAQKMDLATIAASIQDLTTKARANQLSPKEVQGGTFTITNHGVSGSLIATPIINQPQSAILGIGKLQKRVMVIDSHGQDAIQIKPMAYVTLTIDHRALDGFQANKFLSKFVETLESWK